MSTVDPLKTENVRFEMNIIINLRENFESQKASLAGFQETLTFSSHEMDRTEFPSSDNKYERKKMDWIWKPIKGF